MKIADTNVVKVLSDDGIKGIDEKKLRKYENITSVNVDEIRKDLGMGSWAVRLVFNDAFSGVLIQQQPGEGNRRHYHKYADENWIILDGEWEWHIENREKKKVKKGDFVLVPKGTWHQIKCVGKGAGLRYAITQPDVEHIYSD